MALLALVSAWLLLSRRPGTYARSDVAFAVKDTGRITGVEIKDSVGQVMLVKVEGTWRVNGSTPVRRDRMNGLMVMLSRLEVISPVSQSRMAEVATRLQKDGKQVVVSLDKGSDRVYFVWHDTTESDATYMLLKDADTPFRMGVRGYQRKDLSALYATDERFWRDNLLLQYLPVQIQDISLFYQRYPARTFHLARNEEGEFEMSTGTLPSEWFTPVSAKVHQYLGYFYGVRFDAYADQEDDPSWNDTCCDEPDYVLEVISTEGTRTTLRLCPIFRIDAEGNRKMDLNSLYAKVDDWEEMVLVKYPEIDPLLKEPGYFQSH